MAKTITEQKKIIELYSELQKSFAQSSKKMAEVYSELSSKYKVPRALINKMIELQMNQNEFKLLFNLYDLHKEAGEI